MWLTDFADLHRNFFVNQFILRKLLKLSLTAMNTQRFRKENRKE